MKPSSHSVSSSTLQGSEQWGLLGGLGAGLCASSRLLRKWFLWRLKGVRGYACFYQAYSCLSMLCIRYSFSNAFSSCYPLPILSPSLPVTSLPTQHLPLIQLFLQAICSVLDRPKVPTQKVYSLSPLALMLLEIPQAHSLWCLILFPSPWNSGGIQQISVEIGRIQMNREVLLEMG